MTRWLARAVELPELNVAFFSFLLHFVWEMWQVPYFEGMPTTSHWSGVRICTQATFGDAAMAVTAFWAAAGIQRSRRWFERPSAIEWVVYMGVGVGLTVAFEWLATGPLERWSYGPAMPRIPLLGTGLLPALQWIVVPPIALALTARQLRPRGPLESGEGGGER